MKKTALTIGKIALHVLGFPLLFVVVLVINLNCIEGGISYGAAAFASLIVTAVMAAIFYATYFLVRTKKSRSIRNQHIILAIVVVCCLAGLWMAVDAFLPEPLETATSNTLRWEDLSDNWDARADVNKQLLQDYIALNYHLGRLPNNLTLDEYYAQGIRNKDVKALQDLDFASIDKNGYATFVGPSIDYAQVDRMTIPVILHLLLDKREHLPTATIPVPYFTNDGENGYKILRANKQYFVVNDDLEVIDTVTDLYTVTLTDGQYVPLYKAYVGEKEFIEPEEKVGFTTKQEAVDYLKNEYGVDDTEIYTVTWKNVDVNWHVLDMLGTPMEMQLLSPEVADTAIELGPVKLTVGSLLQMDLVPDALAIVAEMVADENILTSPLYISLDPATGTLTLTPSNSSRGTLDYMHQAWLANNGLLYIVVSFFSTRTIFYIFAPIMALLSYALGVIREQEAKLKEADAQAVPDEDSRPAPKTATDDKAAVQATDNVTVDI